MRALLLALLCLSTAGATRLHAERGIIIGPAGALELRSEPQDQATPVATVKEGEVFEFEGIEDSDWRRVTLATGQTGFLPVERIRLFFTLDEIPEKDDPDSELEHHAKSRGFDYCATARAAAQGEAAAMLRYFGITDTDWGGGGRPCLLLGHRDPPAGG